jgi:hypothetical protein
MGFFSRKTKAPNLQLPDALAQQADLQYGHQDFAGAMETYAEGIDKIHTMCVVASASSRIRTLGPGDQGILDGFNSSLGATLAMEPRREVASLVQRTLGYLREIANEAGNEVGRYLQAIDAIETTYRLGKGQRADP